MDGSQLQFHSKKVYLKEIINKINDLIKPKHEFYLIDSCYSGEKIRGEEEITNEDKIFASNLLSLKSESFNILTASRHDQKAKEKSVFKNGTLTHYFLKVIKNPKNYGELGFLSPDAISSIVQVNLSLDENFEQINFYGQILIKVDFFRYLMKIKRQQKTIADNITVANKIHFTGLVSQRLFFTLCSF